MAELWRYPVKSMAGERLERAVLGRLGLPGDRAFALRDEIAGEIRGARNHPVLLLCSARLVREPDAAGEERAEIVLPDGDRLASDDPALAERLSALVGRPVTFHARRPAEDRTHYRRGKFDGPDPVAEIRRLMGRLDDEPFPHFTGFPRELAEFVSPPGTYFDAFPVHVLTSASLAALRDLCPGSDVDVRRFRPNFLVELDEAKRDFVEAGWCGRRLRIGEAWIDVEIPAIRCGIPTRPQAGLAKDPSLLRAIVRHADQNLGVYGSVHSSGAVGVGDPVEIEEPSGGS